MYEFPVILVKTLELGYTINTPFYKKFTICKIVS
jgi:hypothetical protein